MTLLENIYHHLQHNGLVNNREHFSKHYLGKSRNWYAVQTHEGRDFSTSAAIECLRNIRSATNNKELEATQQLALLTAERLVSQHLNQHHAVAEISIMPTYRAHNQFSLHPAT
jgi:hypothetical protein